MFPQIFVPFNLPLHYLGCGGGMRLRVEWEREKWAFVQKKLKSLQSSFSWWRRIVCGRCEWEKGVSIFSLSKLNNGWFIGNKVWWVPKEKGESSYNHTWTNSHHKFKVWKARLVKHDYFKLRLRSKQAVCEKLRPAPSPFWKQRGDRPERGIRVSCVKILIICGWYFLNIARSCYWNANVCLLPWRRCCKKEKK